MGTVVEDAIQSGQALQTSQEADKMHDASRGDGQLALSGALQKGPERIKEAEEGLVTRVEDGPGDPAERRTRRRERRRG